MKSPELVFISFLFISLEDESVFEAHKSPSPKNTRLQNFKVTQGTSLIVSASEAIFTNSERNMRN